MKAKLTVKNDLPEELRQGLFAESGKTFDAIMRFSTDPGDILSDHISSPRGSAIKILGVEGEKTANHQNRTTQDIVTQNAKAFEAEETAAFLKNLAALRPLGNIMPSRLKVYEDIAPHRRRAEGREMIEPQSVEELPD